MTCAGDQELVVLVRGRVGIGEVRGAEPHLPGQRTVPDHTGQDAGEPALALSVEDDMRRRERMASLLDKRDRLDAEVAELDRIIAAKKDDIAKAMSPAWSAIIRPKLASAVAAHRTREAELQAAVTRAQVLHSLADGHDPKAVTGEVDRLD